MTRIIPITKGTGAGETKLAAFDAALWNAGIANYNLIRLSSIIPPGRVPELEKVEINLAKFGEKLYLVYASQIENEIGKEAWAGIGWVMTTEGEKRGLFVEHEGGNRQEVENLIQESLSCMVKYRSEKYGEIRMEVVGVKCERKPVCAIVAAIYDSEGWD